MHKSVISLKDKYCHFLPLFISNSSFLYFFSGHKNFFGFQKKSFSNIQMKLEALISIELLCVSIPVMKSVERDERGREGEQRERIGGRGGAPTVMRVGRSGSEGRTGRSV